MKKPSLSSRDEPWIQNLMKNIPLDIIALPGNIAMTMIILGR